MNTTPGVKTRVTTVTILSVGPIEEDHLALATIFDQSSWPLCPHSKWNLKASESLGSALPILRQERIPIVICERDLGASSWKEMLAQIAVLPDPPALIVTSRVADEYLWAEALNLGAYDVLAKPFDAAEVVRTVSMGWLHRQNRAARRLKTPAAASEPAIPSPCLTAAS